MPNKYSNLFQSYLNYNQQKNAVTLTANLFVPNESQDLVEAKNAISWPIGKFDSRARRRIGNKMSQSAFCLQLGTTIILEKRGKARKINNKS